MQTQGELIKKYLFLIFILFINGYSFSQKKEDDNLYYKQVYNNLNYYNFLKASDALSKINSKDSIYLANYYITDFYLKGLKNKILDNKFLKTTKDLNLKLNYTDYLNYSTKNNDSIIYNNYLEVLNVAKQRKDTLQINESLRRILYYFFKRNNSLNYNKVDKYLSEFKALKNSDWDNFWYEYLNNGFEISKAYFNKTAYPKAKHFKNCLSFAEKTQNKFAKIKANQIIGATYTLPGNKNSDSAFYYFNKSKLLLLKENSFFFKEILSQIYFNFGRIEYDKKNFAKAVNLFKKAKENKQYANQSKLKYYLYISKGFEENQQKDSAFYYLKIHNKLKDSLNLLNQSIAISDIKEKYNTLENEKQILQLEKENLQIESKRKQNFNLLIIALLTIITGSFIYILSYKNSQRKRKLAEQEKELETIKNLTLLKEQEITTINAMVDGQEKERKRIAEDLHDNLGSVLATLKLHFENLKINREKKKIDQKELFNKTENLIDEAYLKVRRIAHAKNAGVIANQGLLLAIQMMAEKISSADKIQIEVIHFGLDKRLENTLEITLFRIIQELITNIIKHADAKNATINISLYDKNLNIIIEDDGKGFDIKKVNLNNGMGISSIKTRVEHLNGNFKVDSTLGKGSSIILDIPVS
ncbi:hypothetical protein KO506_14135 [Polaribacter vadi]|uniref:sensor histidine kinase n=1 Tax=Polaribacter TaxID=52959 RepID=UPI001C093CF6|nr:MULTISPECIES: ATP-binding protein [Polaribacter]MBU3012548.1 hypothetical protein [Polaribacter vadi]MDO6742365.1 ATP-binding protein [Polaribacter sp. 1_MG-2023]